jgi:hypothetical protein
MTKEEFKNSLDYKFLSKSLKQQFPYLVGIEPIDNFEDKESLYPNFIHVDFIFSLEKLLETFPYWEPYTWTKQDLNKQGFSESYTLGALVNCSDEDNCPEEPIKVVIGIEQYGEKTLKNSKKALPRGMRSSKEIFMTQKMYVVK